jgi:hypothetical protein
MSNARATVVVNSNDASIIPETVLLSNLILSPIPYSQSPKIKLAK